MGVGFGPGLGFGCEGHAKPRGVEHGEQQQARAQAAHRRAQTGRAEAAAHHDAARDGLARVKGWVRVGVGVRVRVGVGVRGEGKGWGWG